MYFPSITSALNISIGPKEVTSPLMRRRIEVPRKKMEYVKFGRSILTLLPLPKILISNRSPKIVRAPLNELEKKLIPHANHYIIHISTSWINLCILCFVGYIMAKIYLTHHRYTIKLDN